MTGRRWMLASVVVLVAGCATDALPRPSANGAADGPESGLSGGTRAQACKSGDRRVPDESACLQDDAACYRIADGGWCTGVRGNTCPAGSSALPAGVACPGGATCFRMGPGLDCRID